MGTTLIRYFLLGAGGVLCLGGSVRFYRVIINHTEDPLFAPHLLLVLLSLLISWKILKIGMDQNEKTLKDAISLIRSGSVLMMIWGYRLFLLLTTKAVAGFRIDAGLSILYVLLGTLVMCIGLKISRPIRRQVVAATAEMTAPVGHPMSAGRGKNTDRGVS
ncbi:MAG: hypothetical protein AAB300_02250 [Nitrospirota bacterium]